MNGCCLGSNHNLSGVMFLDFDFDGVPELVAQKADSNEYSFHSVVYKFEDGKLKEWEMLTTVLRYTIIKLPKSMRFTI